jgi:hypothetical protein
MLGLSVGHQVDTTPGVTAMLRTSSFPMPGAIVEVEFGDEIPGPVAIAAIRIAISTGAYHHVKGKLTNPMALGRSIVQSRMTLYVADRDAYTRQAAIDIATLASAARVTHRAGDPDVALVCDVMLTRRRYRADGSLDLDLEKWIGDENPRWIRTLLGHGLGDPKHAADCAPCQLAADRQWPLLLRRCGVSNRLLLDLYHAAVMVGALLRLDHTPSGHSQLDDHLQAVGAVF